MNRVQFITFAGGADYVQMAGRLQRSIQDFCRFPTATIPLLLDQQRAISTLHKPAIILAHQDKLTSPYTIFVDADMEVVAPIRFEDICPGSGQQLVAVEHFFYSGGDCQPKDSNRTCWTPPGLRGSRYWQGCLFGGRTRELIVFLQGVAHLIWADSSHGATGDEPYLNHELNRRRNEVRTLSCTFAAPMNFPWGPRFQQMYEMRAEGRPPVIRHHNFSNPDNHNLVI